MKYQKAFLIALVIILATVISVLLNFSQLELAGRPIKSLSAENAAEVLGGTFENDFVEFKGTINSLQILQKENNQYFYAGLQEFGNKIIVRAERSKLNSSQQTFVGQVKTLKNGFGEDLVDKMNESIKLNGNAEDFNQMLIDKIEENSLGNFDNNSLLVIDGIRVNQDKIITQTVILTVLISLLFFLLLRDRIFVI